MVIPGHVRPNHPGRILRSHGRHDANEAVARRRFTPTIVSWLPSTRQMLGLGGTATCRVARPRRRRRAARGRGLRAPKSTRRNRRDGSILSRSRRARLHRRHRRNRHIRAACGASPTWASTGVMATSKCSPYTRARISKSLGRSAHYSRMRLMATPPAIRDRRAHAGPDERQRIGFPGWPRRKGLTPPSLVGARLDAMRPALWVLAATSWPRGDGDGGERLSERPPAAGVGGAACVEPGVHRRLPPAAAVHVRRRRRRAAGPGGTVPDEHERARARRRPDPDAPGEHTCT